ncbi:TonB-dependent receptor [Azomonas macrocytogenes]|uniref:Iron complex outermembrane receptor protein n=1 Tax=Azomonas macrocytogenes TaxID=69962 RepID=A0A839T390_AZOMA|nr:TonB-dependent siderophore receptor [Azomonas macrocytogenes]MBB3103140.1 iron complex outermembrane receptor protein [Azomonas macrocytogenes]
MFKITHPGHWISLVAASLVLPLAHAEDAEEEERNEKLELSTMQIGAQQEQSEGSAQSGYRTSTATAGPLGKVPLKDTPYSLNVTSRELFENRGAHTVSQALKTNPTVSTLAESNTYSGLSRVMIRGFTAGDQGDFRDGVVDRSFTFVPLENVERIEVLNGLSSFLYGFTSLGGSLNYVSKQPTAAPLASLAVGRYGGGIDYQHVDLGGPIDQAGRLSYRLNLYDESGDTYVEGSHQERSLVSGVLSYQLTPDTRVFADIWYQDLDMRGLQTYINVNPAGGIKVPSARHFDAETQYGQDWSYNKSHKTLSGIGFESNLNEVFTLRSSFRYGNMWRAYQYTTATLTDNDGNYRETARGSTRQTERTYSGFALLDANFRTGFIGHKLTMGFTGHKYQYTRGNDVTTALGMSTIDAPTTYARPIQNIGPTNVWYKQFYRNWVIGDRLEFNDAWSAVIGFNRAEIRQKTWGSGTSLGTAKYTQRKTTPSYSLIYKPIPTLTTYVTYMEGLVNGGSAPATAANAYEILSPSKSEQYEIGAKATVGRMDLTLALFHIDKVNEYTDPADNTYKKDGREVHKGIEFTATGKLTDNLTLVGGYTLMTAEVTKAKNNKSLEGNIPVNVPEKQGRLYVEYNLSQLQLPDVTLSGAANYSGRRPVDAANNDYLHSSTTYDAGIRYQPEFAGHRLTFNLFVNNLFDKDYWSYYRTGDGLLLGAPRMTSFTAKLDW